MVGMLLVLPLIWAVATGPAPLAVAAKQVELSGQAAPDIDRIKYVVVIYLENHSFDNLYGRFPGANGLDQASPSQRRQIDRKGAPYTVLPEPLAPPAGGCRDPDARFPQYMPPVPFPLNPYLPLDEPTGDLIHAFYREQYQIDGGTMAKFAAWSDALAGKPHPLFQYHQAQAATAGAVRIVGPTQTCSPLETAMDWNSQGPPGRRGPPARRDPPGPQGRKARPAHRDRWDHKVRWDHSPG